jgi:hypothetical protein
MSVATVFVVPVATEEEEPVRVEWQQCVRIKQSRVVDGDGHHHYRKFVNQMSLMS